VKLVGGMPKRSLYTNNPWWQSGVRRIFPVKRALKSVEELDSDTETGLNQQQKKKVGTLLYGK